uniref:ATP synthase F0 subunit 8 n=1 Tax=Mastigoproctus giganteus TaxID=58767 RepID=Q535F0_MASGI|nr:ATP synthase F0 subunit 8 [Mastigoproctus giganteus]
MPQMSPMNWIFLEITIIFFSFIWLFQFSWMLPTSPISLPKPNKTMTSWFW